MTAPIAERPLSISVVVPTHGRPREVRRAIDSIITQHYDGDLEVIVVHDREEVDLQLAELPRVRVLKNDRSPGLAGARNTGILASNADLVAFCDDDDYWLPGKLTAQVRALRDEPRAVLATCSIAVDFDGRTTPRPAGVDRVTHAMLVRSRMAMLHSSTLVFRRSALTGELGLINEEIPGSQNEDWDILLRAARLHDIVHVDEPLVNVVWGRASFFSRRWDTKIASSVWMLENHPEIAADGRAAARVMGQIAFACACDGQRRAGWRWSWRTARASVVEPRWLIAALVAVWPRSGEWVLSSLHRLGRGL